MVGRGRIAGPDVRAVAGQDLAGHQTRSDRQPTEVPGTRRQPVEQRTAVRPGAKSGLRLPVPARHLLSARRHPGAARLGDAAAVVGATAHNRVLGTSATGRSAGYRLAGFSGHCGRGLRPVAPRTDHDRRHLVGDAADDAGAVGAAAGHPGAARCRVAAGARRAVGVGAGVHGCGERGRHADRMPGRADLVGLSPAEPVVVAVHRVVGAVLGAGHRLVGGRAGHAGPDQSPVPRLHRILRCHNAMDVAHRDAARHRQLDSVRRTQRHSGRLAGDRHGCGAGHHPGRGGRAGRAGDALDACPRPPGDDAADRYRPVGGRILGRPWIASGTRGSSVSRRDWNPVAQRAQAGAGDPVAVGARPGPLARPHSAAGKLPAAGMGARVRPPRERQARRGRHRGVGCPGDGHLAGMDRTAHPAGRIRRDPPVLAPDRRLARRAQRGFTGGAGARGTRCAVRHAGVGNQSRRAAPGTRQQRVGCARLDPAHAARDDSRT